MNKNILIGVLIFVGAQLGSWYAIKQNQVLLAAGIYWGGFFMLLGLAIWNAYQKKLSEKMKEQLEKDKSGHWIAPISKKVAWDSGVEKSEDEFCMWQGYKIPRVWFVNGKRWEWIKHTRKDEWPNEMEVSEDLRWWHGIAIYKEVEKEDEKGAAVA